MKKEVFKKSVAPFYLVGAVWLIYAALFPLYRLLDFLWLILISLGVFEISRRLFKGKMTLVEVEEPKVATGDAKADEMIAAGKAYLKEIRAVNDAVADPELTVKISRLEEISAKIFDHVAENPRKAPDIRRFLEYYLPVALKLLKAYDTRGRQGVKGENITQSMAKIEGVMDTVVKAFEGQLDTLFQDKALDIATDITVLQSMLAQEGLIDGMKAGEPEKIPEIRLRL